MAFVSISPRSESFSRTAWIFMVPFTGLITSDDTSWTFLQHSVAETKTKPCSLVRLHRLVRQALCSTPKAVTWALPVAGFEVIPVGKYSIEELVPANHVHSKHSVEPH
jgi:hypothetical protein